MEDLVTSDASSQEKNVGNRGGVPWWITAAVIVLILAILGVGAALVYSVFNREDVPLTLAQRDVVFYQDQAAKKPQDIQAHISLSNALLAAGRYQEAINEAEKAITLKPKNLGGYYAKASALAASGATALAMAEYDKVLKLLPSDGEALFRKALLQAKSGDLAAATKVMELSVKAQPTSSDAHFELGRLYEQQGAKGKAIDQYRESLKYVPDYAPALEALKRLGADKQE